MVLAGALWLLSGPRVGAQAPSGPLAPKPGVPLQLPPKARIKVQVALVNAPVTVRDAGGRMVHNLEAHDFQVTDNGVAQTITHFDLGGDPLSLVILVETSSRIEPMMPEIRKTGILFTQTVRGPSGEVAVVGFNDAIDKLEDFTASTDAIENTMAQLEVGTPGSRLYDAMSVGVEMLSGQPQAVPPGCSNVSGAVAPCPNGEGRRRVLLILAEATDAGSTKQLGEVLRQAQLANITIYSVGLSTTRAQLQAKPKPPKRPNFPVGAVPGPPGVPDTPTYEETRYGNVDMLAAAVWAVQHIHDQVKDHALELAAAATGGAHLTTFKDRSIEKAIDEIGGELHSQYSLSYAPTGSGADGYHEIKVSVLRKDAKSLKVRARPGYYLTSSED